MKVALTATALVVAALVVVGFVYALAERYRAVTMAPLHHYSTASPSSTLTDVEALACARRAIAAEGYATALWTPIRHDATRSPDGKPDVYLLRGPTADQGEISFFTNDDKGRFKQIYVVLKIKNREIDCTVDRGK